MTFQDFWKKAKKAVAIQVEEIKNIPNSNNDLSSPLNNGEYIDATHKLKSVSVLINQTLENFQRLAQSVTLYASTQRICSQTFLSESLTNMIEMDIYKEKSISFERNIMSTIVEDINKNKDLALLSSKLPEIKRLQQIHEKLHNNLLLKKRAEDKVTNLIRNGSVEQRQTASAEFDKRSEKSLRYQNDLDEGIERLSIETCTILKSLDVFYRSLVQKFVDMTSNEFISETVPVEAFIGSYSSDDEKNDNQNQNVNQNLSKDQEPNEAQNAEKNDN